MNLSISRIITTPANTTVIGKGASGNTVTIVNNGVTLGTTTVDNNGNWQITFPAAGNGSFTVQSGGKEEDITVGLLPGGLKAKVTTTIPVIAQAAPTP